MLLSHALDAQFSLGVFLAVESCKYRMFAVLLWALRVHMIFAAARFSSIESLVLFFGSTCGGEAFSAVDLSCGYERLAF